MLEWQPNWKETKRRQYNRKPHMKKCEECGKEYDAKQHWKTRKYCSRSCFAKARGRETQKYELKETVCPICGTKFEYKKREGYKDRVYCCKDCASIALGERMKNNKKEQ